MMTQKRSGRWAISKITLALPAVVALGLLFSASTLHQGKTVEKIGPEAKSIGIAVSAPDTSKYQVPDKQPVFPGGDEARSKFFAENIKYPAEAMKNKVTGKVFVSFNVAKNGAVTDVKLVKGIGSGCDEEAVRVVKLMPKWKPGEYKGKPVETNFVMPIKFALDCDKKDGQKTEIKFVAPVDPAKK